MVLSLCLVPLKATMSAETGTPPVGPAGEQEATEQPAFVAKSSFTYKTKVILSVGRQLAHYPHCLEFCSVCSKHIKAA